MEQKNSRKRKLLHKIILAVLVCTAVVSGARVIMEQMESRRVQEEYERLARAAKQEETREAETSAAEPETEAETGSERETETQRETEPEYVSPINFEELSRLNPDVIAWIQIPGTNIDYPIVQGDDNEVYLHRSFEGEETTAGTIFLDFESQSDLRGYNNIIYGHHMRNGTMFRDIVYYKEQDYFKEHQYFEIYTPKETIHLKAVSCYYIENDPMVRKTRFKTSESYEAYVQAMLSPCPYAEIPEEPVKNLYTLVTCSYEVSDGRTVLFAVEVDEEEAMAAGTRLP